MQSSDTNRLTPVQARLDIERTYHPPLNSRSSTKVLGGDSKFGTYYVNPSHFSDKKVLRGALTDT